MCLRRCGDLRLAGPEAEAELAFAENIVAIQNNDVDRLRRALRPQDLKVRSTTGKDPHSLL
jgi:hypothetical protein